MLDRTDPGIGRGLRPCGLDGEPAVSYLAFIGRNTVAVCALSRAMHRHDARLAYPSDNARA